MQVNIRSVDEAVVIGAALSLSSSAFVLQVIYYATMPGLWMNSANPFFLLKIHFCGNIWHPINAILSVNLQQLNIEIL